MPHKLPSLDDTRTFLMALGKALFPSQNWGSVRSYHGRRTTFLSGAVTQIMAHIDTAQRDAHPLTAGAGAPIAAWGSALGVEQKSATPARKAKAGRVAGAAGATAAIGAQLRHTASGLLYELAQNVTIPGVAGVDPASFYDADIVAVDVGAKTRLEKNEVLAFVETPEGIETNVVLQLALDEDGYDAEQFGSYRNRVLAALSQAPSGGNQSDFVKWALAALNTVASAYAYPNRAGRGTIDVAAFYAGSGSSRALSVGDRAAVLAYLQVLAPFQVAGPGGGLRVIETIPDPQPVEILLTPNGQNAYAFDWDDSNGPTVSAWDAATRTLTFSTGLPVSLLAGHRLVLAGNAHDGREYKIEAIASGGTAVILEEVPAFTVTAGGGTPDKIYSGGPLVTPVRDAIVAHLDGQVVYAGRGQVPLAASAVDSPVGLLELADGVGPANPGGTYGSWAGGIVRATLAKIAMYKAGVRNAVVTTPAADYEATDDAFPNDDQIHYVTPGAVVIRKG